MDLKWQLALLSMRERRYFQKTGKKITINGSDTAGYDKTKVECFNCHKMGQFTRECRSVRNQESRPRNQDSSRKMLIVEDTSSKAMVAIDGACFNWSYMADDEVPTNMALMAFSDSEVHNSKTCSNTCLKSFETLKTQYDNLRIEFNKSEFNLATYKRGLFAPPTIDLSNSSLEEFKEPEFKGYGPKARNKSYLTGYQEYDGGFVVSASSSKGGKITGKGKTRTGKLDFEDVYFVKELKFNLFSVSQMRDKKNSVLFTETECLILFPDFKLPDESQVLLKVPKKNNMYNLDLKNVVPSKDLACLFEKATNDESNLWHKRLGHINFKTMNKLMKGNLVRGLPSNIFENDHTCVAFQKEKQHKASYKSKLVNSVSQPLQILYTDLFGPTFINSIMGKMYCLVVTDDYSRVLMTKPHNKTPYKLLIGRTPTISFMRPFGCLVTILNTLDHLGKFKGKAKEGFLVGYSTNNKAFRVYNSRTRKVDENLHVNFLENKPNITGSGLEWLFDIDSLITSMNYQPISAGNRTNGNAGSKIHSGVGQVRKEKVPDQEYILLPLLNTSLDVPSSHEEVDSLPKDDAGKKSTAEPTCVEGSKIDDLGSLDHQIKSTDDFENTNNINSFNTASLIVNDASNKDGTFQRIIGKWDFSTPITVNADYNNLETVIPVSPFPSTRFHKDHPKEQIIREVNSAVQTRKIAKQNEAELITFIIKKRRTNHKDFQNCLFACFLSQMEPKKVTQDLDDESWVEAIQEEGIDYDEVFAPVARIEAIRPDIMFAVCACLRFQVQPKVTHMHAMKRIFRYLKGQPTLGLWYPKDSPLDLIAYYDSDYVGASLDRKSTTGGCQFLGSRLISWQCKKQKIMANSTTEPEYIAASNCYGQVLWLQNQLLDYGYNFMQTKIHVDNESEICVLKNPIYHLNTKHIEIRHHFFRDSYEKRLIEMVKIHTDYNVADLLTKAFDVTRFLFLVASIGLELKGYLINDGYADLVQHAGDYFNTAGQTATRKEFSIPLMAGSLAKTISAKFWNTASSKIINSAKQIHVIVDGKAIVISKSSVRSDLLFDDEDAITCLTNDDIFENLAFMGYEPLFTKLTFQKDEAVHQEEGDRVERAITTDASLEAAHASDNIFMTQTTLMPNVDISQEMATGGSPMRQDTIGGTSAQTRSERVFEQPSEPPILEGHTSGSGEDRMEHPFELTDFVPPTPYDSPLSGGYTPRSDEGRLKLEELMVLCTTLANRVTTLENELSTTKAIYHKAFITLTKQVKKLETQLKKKRSRAVIHSSDEEEPSVDIEDSPKHRRMIKELDKDEDVNLERYNLEKALELQRPLDQRKEDVAKGDQAKKIDWNDPTVLRYHALQNRPFSKAEVRKNMIMYLKNQGGEDLEILWKLVQDKHGDTRLEEGYERVLWGDLKVMFKPDVKSEVWRQLQGHDITVWKLFSLSGVHFVRFKSLHIFLLVDKVYHLTLATITKMLERKLQDG
uniref:Putative ribonuclease H-like domain-containing protein n=1 Tax=Tanacetum cinerariifolium TaxID=118510 RepID=A0A6L2LIQ6_TANCI|nr:putative ribonuclease H-like domain-containing protein [Tanacetum cinerariifolium]